MINVESVRLKNIVTYKDETFIFEPGLTLVKGENRAGKSLLFSSLANLLYFSHPLADKKDAKAILAPQSREIAESKEESPSITLNISKGEAINKTTYSIKQKAAKESITYQIQENDQDLDSRTIALSKSLIEEIFTQPEDIFYTSTYLTSYRNHPLLHGSTAQRYEFFEKLFNFEFFDFLYDKLNEELKDLEAKKVEYNNLNSLLLELPSKQLELEAASIELEALQSRRDILQGELSHLTQVRVEVIRLLDIQEDLEKMNTRYSNLRDNNSTILVLYENSEDLDAHIVEQETLYTSRLEIEKQSKVLESKEVEYLQAQASLTQSELSLSKSRQSLDEILKTINNISQDLTNRTVAELQDDLNSVRSQINADELILQNKSIEQWQNIFSKALELEALTSLGLNLPVEQIRAFTAETLALSIQDLQREQTTINYQITEINSKLQKISNLTNHVNGASHELINCPSCYSELKPAQLAAYKTELSEEILDKNKVLLEVERKLSQYTRYQKCFLFLKNSATEEKVNESYTRLSNNRIKIVQLENYIAVRRDFAEKERTHLLYVQREQDLIQSLSVARTNKENNSAGLADSDYIRKLIEVLKNFKKAKEDLSTINSKVLTKIIDLQNLVKPLSFFSETFLADLTKENLAIILPKTKAYLEERITLYTGENTSMQTSITSNSVTLSIVKKEILQLETYANRVVILAKALEQYETVLKLTKVFHAKGFRLEKIKYFTQVFESTLNKYSGFLFMEPFSFSISVEKRDLAIIATRAGKSSDVRYLSGSESRCFQLLCLISILSLLPSSKKTNICILDEMDAGCDESTTQMFYESFLPELRNIVPTVVVISPLKDSGFYINEDRSYMIRKVQGVSSALLLDK